jgi:guanylate kinase
MNKYPKNFGFCVSHTTRDPRPGEENGVHYNFVEKSLMQKAIDNKEFLEHAHVHNNIYGTSFASVDQVCNEGKVCILDIDTQGCQSVKNINMICKYLFVMPPSVEDLSKRLKGRGTESDDKIAVRLENAIKEIEYGKVAGNFEAVLVNDDVDVCFIKLEETLINWFPDMKMEAVTPVVNTTP